MMYLRLFWEFFKTGLFSVGGGLATLPFIYDMSDRTGWFTYQQIADMVAVSESTPGPIGVNTATYVGYVTAGVPGSLIATLGLVTPAVICILIIASCLKKFRENRFVDHAFYGLRPASAGLIAAAGFAVVRISLLQESTFRASGRFADLFFWKGLLLAAVLLLGGVTGLLCWLLKRSYDRVEKKAEGAVPKAEFDKQLDSCKSQIRAIQETYTTRATHDKDIDECRKKISKISEVYLTKEDFYREQAKTERKLEQQNQKLDRVLEILMQMQRKENA